MRTVAPCKGSASSPDVRVEPTLAGIRAGRDEFLERALGDLRQALLSGRSMSYPNGG